ncbi:hypothetical protein M9Y10_020896 [Tritrichomonas musculus]|uniref:Leucine-rich repeat domain-containing protein n=1 Tax=Tritrichomonas musculus TaxID=1915356 RepID=A0ABR2HEV7_9EUKA
MGSAPTVPSSQSISSSPFHSQQLSQTQVTQHHFQSLASLPFSIGQLDEKQIALYDIPNSKEMQKKYDNATIKMLFNQFQNSYFNFYCKRAKQNNISIDLDKRKNISILVIVGSSIKNAQSKHIEGTYQKNSEDLSSALLIRHLFHFTYGVTSIKTYTFCGSPMREITIPSSVTSIEDSAFAGCSSLTQIEIPSSVTSIGKKYFRWMRVIGSK